MRNRYIFGPERAHDRAKDGRAGVEAHQLTMDALDGAINSQPDRKKARYSKIGRRVVLALRQVRTDVDDFLENHVINSRFGLLTGLREDDSWRTMVPSVTASTDGVVRPIPDGQSEIHTDSANDPVPPALNDEID